MTAQELLSQLRAKGVELKAVGDDRLIIDAPKGTITTDLRSALAELKPQLLDILKTEAKIPAGPATERPVPAPPITVNAPATLPAPPPIEQSIAEEIRKLETELMRLRTEEEARRNEAEAGRRAAEDILRKEQEQWGKQEEEMARRRAEKERQRIEAEARERAEEEKRRQIAEEEARRAEEQLARLRSIEASRRREVDEYVRKARAAHEAELAALRQAEEQQAKRRTNEERQYLETEARNRAQEEELRRRAEMRIRAIEEEIERVGAREQARVTAAQQAERLTEEAERRLAEEDARRQAEEKARRRAEEEARLRVEIEAQLRAEAAERRRVEEEARVKAEEEARRRAEEEAILLAAERARRLAEEEAQRRAEEEARRQAEDAARLRAEEEARHQAEEQARLNAEREARERAEAELRERAELEARIRAEIEAKIRAEEDERRQAEEEARRRVHHERVLAEEAAREAAAKSDSPSQFERSVVDERPSSDEYSPKAETEITEWFESNYSDRTDAAYSESETSATSSAGDFEAIHNDSGGEFRPVSLPEDQRFAGTGHFPAALTSQLGSSRPSERATAVAELPRIGGEEAFRQICNAFDDQAIDVRSAAARAMFELQEDRAAAFTRALREASPDRRRKIGSAIASSGLANEAIRNLTGESRDKTYDAFSLLFLMSKAGEVQPLMRAIDEHPNIEVRLAVVKLLALSGQPETLSAFRRMAVRGSLPPEVRSAVMEAIYQITSQSAEEATTQ